MTTTITMTSPNHTLMLRTCTREDDGRLTAHGGFVWPALGPVECPDWNPIAECGNGLHGFLRGCGDAGLANWTDKAAWLVVEIEVSDIVNLEGKVKVPRGRVLFSGDRLQALELMARLGHLDEGHMGGTATAGDGGTATAGYRGTATAGDGGTATAGDGGTVIIAWWDDKTERMRKAIGYIGEDGMEAGKKYNLKDAKFVEVK